MKLALLGNDLDALALARAAAAAGHAVVWVADAPNLPEFDDCLAPVEQWEDLFDDDLADAVIVGRGSADPQLCSRRVQELVKQGRAVLTTFPLVPSVLSYFEIDMARGESGAAVRHFNPVLGSAPLELLRTALAGTLAELGTVESVTCERALADRSRENVMWHFARDVEMLDAVVGGLDRVGAHGGAGRGPDDPQAYAGLSVQLSGRDERPVRWNVVPAHGDPAMRVTLLGEQGRVTVVWDVAGRAVRATLHTGAGDKDFPLSESDAAARAIEELAAACGPAPSAARSTWGAALHAMELADTI
ncbi:MAG: hypothetical protein KDA44_18100, partial [Planctomycetales bacterium]|nr:hypothetical protein [Planctomycetales bacterium]